jgi:hypothetical protein
MSTYSLALLPDWLTICRLPAGAAIPPWAMAALNGAGFAAITRTHDELSVVCGQAYVPDPAHTDAVTRSADTSGDVAAIAPEAGLRVDADWRAFHVKGPFAFTEVGVLASLTTTLANAMIGIFAISTFDTDYLLVKTADVGAATLALRTAGHTVESDADRP